MKWLWADRFQRPDFQSWLCPSTSCGTLNNRLKLSKSVFSSVKSGAWPRRPLPVLKCYGPRPSKRWRVEWGGFWYYYLHSIIIWKVTGFPYLERRGSVSPPFSLVPIHTELTQLNIVWQKSNHYWSTGFLQKYLKWTIHSLPIFIEHLLCERLEWGLGETHRHNALLEQQSR